MRWRIAKWFFVGPSFMFGKKRMKWPTDPVPWPEKLANSLSGPKLFDAS
jgi:hypothetical protein